MDKSFVPDISYKHNVSRNATLIPKNELLQSLYLRQSIFKDAIKHFLPNRAYNFIKKAILYLNGKEIQLTVHTPMPEDVKARLLDEYRKDISDLEDLIEQDLSHWLE